MQQSLTKQNFCGNASRPSQFRSLDRMVDKCLDKEIIEAKISGRVRGILMAKTPSSLIQKIVGQSPGLEC